MVDIIRCHESTARVRPTIRCELPPKTRRMTFDLHDGTNSVEEILKTYVSVERNVSAAGDCSGLRCIERNTGHN
jgi:hypothetical protein